MIFTSHQKSGYKTITIALAIVTIIEAPALHFLLSLWSSFIAWIVTIFTLLIMLYMIWDYLAYSRSPIKIEDDYLYFNLGSKINSKIRLKDISDVQNTTMIPDEKKREYLQLTPFIEFNTLMYFHTPQQFNGLFGRKHKSDKILIFIDDYHRFKEELMKVKGDLNGT